MKKLTILGITVLTAGMLSTSLPVKAAPVSSGLLIGYGSNGNIRWGILAGGSSCPSLPGGGNLPIPTLPDNCIPVLPDIVFPDTPNCNLPGNGTPDTELPDYSTPDTEIPDHSAPSPETPDHSAPDTGIPDHSAPSPETPDHSAPDIEIPDTSAPDTSIPDSNTPDHNLPGSGPSENETPEEESSSSQTSLFIGQVVSLVNAERAKAGLAPLSLDTSMEAAAMVRAKEIQASFSHTRPNGSSFSTALKEAGVSYRRAGENIAWGQKTPKEVVNAWMNSSGHRANIMSPEFSRIGVGYRTNASGTPYWVQLFAN